MRRQIRGLTQASINCQDAISMVQTAEGALNEIHDMLHRGSELSIQAANDTNTEKDKQYIQSEINQLITEIDRVRESTTFNEINVLKGGQIPGKGNYKVDTDDGKFYVGNTLPGFITSSALSIGHLDNIYTDTSGNTHASGTMDFTSVNSGNINNLVGTSFNVDCATCDNKYTFKFVDGNSNSSLTSGSNHIYTIGIGNATNGSELLDRMISAVGTTPGNHYTSLQNNDGVLLMYDNRNSTGTSFYQVNSKVLSGEAYDISDLDLLDELGAVDIYIQAGSESGSDQVIGVRLPNIDSKLLGINGVSVTGTGAVDAIGKFKHALEYVSTERARMGAYQNRFEHTIKNLDNVVENTTASESRIRDTDMAKEMVALSISNILEQAGMSVMSQANQSTSGILSILG